MADFLPSLTLESISDPGGYGCRQTAAGDWLTLTWTSYSTSPFAALRLVPTAFVCFPASPPGEGFSLSADEDTHLPLHAFHTESVYRKVPNV